MSSINNSTAQQIQEIQDEVKKLRENLTFVKGGSMSAKAQLPALLSERSDFNHQIAVLNQQLNIGVAIQTEDSSSSDELPIENDQDDKLKRLVKLRDHIQTHIIRLRKSIKDANILVPHFEQALQEKASTLYGLQHNTEQEEQECSVAPCSADFAC